MSDPRPLSPGRLSRLSAAVADTIASFLRVGDDVDFVAARHGVSARSVKQRMALREAAEKRWKALLERVRGRLPEGRDPWDFPTPEQLARDLGDPVGDVRSALNSEAHSRLQPAVWAQWMEFRDRERRQGPGGG